MKRAIAAVAIVLSSAHSSCMSLDSFLFTAVPETSYQLPYGAQFPAMDQVPAAQREVVQYQGSDGTTVALVWATQTSATMATAPTVIYSHGQTDNIDRYWERASLIWSLGANVVIYDYPGYGMTPGQPTEATVYQTARAAGEFVRSLGTQIDQTRVYEYGYSLGSGPATEMVTESQGYRGLILESAFTSIGALVADGSLVVPRSFVMTSSFDNLSKIQHAAANTPLGVLFFHGDSDTYVQTQYGIDLDQAVQNGEASGAVPAHHEQLVLIAGADHNGVPCLPPGDPPCLPRPVTDPYASNLSAFLMR